MRNSGANILVIDDEKVVADMLVEWLNGEGYNAVAAYGGAEGLRAFDTGNFAIVITDFVMPEVDGMEVLETVRRIDRHAVAIMVTGYGTIEAAVKAIQYGAYDFIEKPIQFEVLKIVLNRALEKRRIFRKLSIFRGLFFTALTVTIILLGLIFFHLAFD